MKGSMTMRLTKELLMNQKALLEKQLEEVNMKIEALPKTLKLRDNEMPFKHWSIAERQNLFDISEEAYEYLHANQDKTIEDVNYLQITDEAQIVLER